MISVNESTVSSLISSIPVDISEYCFSNLFCFQKEHKFEYTTILNLPFIKGENPGIRYLMPLFTPSATTLPIIKKIMGQESSLYPIPEEWVELFNKDKDFFITAFEKDTDYVFLTKRLAEMAGSKLSKKRNLISQFLKSCDDISEQTFTQETMKDAKLILDTWVKDSSDNADETDYDACLLGINNFKSLNLNGIVIYKANMPIAFCLGEIIRNDYILHFAKANIRCKGVYQYLFQRIAQHLNTVEWINFEQDLGNPSLQKMKSSYYPDRYIKKYTISLASIL